MKMKIGAIIQARVSSTRLPRKVLMELPYNSGITVLQQVIRRVKKSEKVSKIIVATTREKEDDEILEIAKYEKTEYFRGDKEDVLSRFYFAAKEHNLEIIVRVTSDCPCIDPKIIDLVIEKHLENQSDYTSNALERTFPHGMDVEVFNFATLEKAYISATQDFEREHVTPYIYKTSPDLFKITILRAPKELKAPDIRITLDTKEDYALLCAVFDFLYEKNPYFDVYDIVRLFDKKPWLKFINEKVMQKKIFNTIEEEIEEAKKLLELQELNRAKEILERWKE